MRNVIGPLVTVVMPTYNHAQFIARAIKSVLDQTYKNWELIVIDNYSQDKTESIVASFTDPRITLQKTHNGGLIAASRNIGIRAAKGEWIAFLDSDDWWTTNKLEVCFEKVNKNTDFLYHNLEIIRDTDFYSVMYLRKTIKTRQLKKPVIIDLLVNGNAIGTSSVLVRKYLLDQIGGMEENKNTIASEDYNTWLRIGKISENFCYVPKILGYYSQQNQSVSLKDMSTATRCACEEFLCLLNDKQKSRLEANLRYMRGRFAFVARNYNVARSELIFSSWYGSLSIKLKSIFMLAVILKTMW